MTSYDAQAADIHLSAAKAGVEEATVGSPTTSTPRSGRMDQALERFFALPHLVVLALMWVVGATFLGSCALVVYAVVSVLLQLLAGSM